MSRNSTRQIARILGAALILSACTPAPGPDKQGGGTLAGAAVGAGAGAVTGFQVAAGSGPGALVGAGLGAIAGGVQGAISDEIETEDVAVARSIAREREQAYAQMVLAQHYERRRDLFPTRDIFPADVFFDGDGVAVRPGAAEVVRQLAQMNRDRLSWSRLVVAAYVKSKDPESTYARHLAEERAKAIANLLVRDGIEARRVMARAVIISEPLVIDPDDDIQRYNQAIELIPLDR